MLKKSTENEDTNKASAEDIRRHYLSIADGLANRVEVAQEIVGVTGNTDVVGAFAEAAVNQLIREIVAPANVSSGTVLTPLIASKRLPQVDTIIWSPMPFPAVYEIRDVAVVPYESVLSILEVKRSSYRDGLKHILRLSEMSSCLMKSNAAKFLGVICVVEGRPSAKLKELVRAKQCVWLLTRTKKGLVPNHHGFLKLVQFLVKARSNFFGSGNQGLNPFAVDEIERLDLEP